MIIEFHPEPGVPYFCVVGSPISHSRSPQIHQLFATQFGLRLSYERVEVRPGQLKEALRAFQAVGGRGMNVTVPLKEEACRLAARVEPAAAEAGAANTLWFDPQGSLVADNTDGVGLVRDLTRNLGCSLAGKRILILGAGGAARGVLPVLLRERPVELVVQNRTRERAVALSLAFGGLGPITIAEWGAPASAPYEVIVNATSAGLSGQSPDLHRTAVSEVTWCYDMMYGPVETPFLENARGLGCGHRRDGLGMLVEQAAKAFAIWHAREPETRSVIAAVRNAMESVS